MRSGDVELGLGLLSIGRGWGVAGRVPPTAEGALALLRAALDLGIRTFDTAPAYGRSETLLGTLLGQVGPTVRAGVIVMTKAGETWDETDGTSTVGHDEAGLRRSIDRSLKILGRINVLQIHRASAGVPTSAGVVAAVRYARQVAIEYIGASVTDLEAGFEAVRSGLYDVVQIPLNQSDATFLPLLPAMKAAGIRVVVNRPYAMGALLGSNATHEAMRQAFGFASQSIGRGTILTGTGSIPHLRANVRAFSDWDG